MGGLPYRLDFKPNQNNQFFGWTLYIKPKISAELWGLEKEYAMLSFRTQEKIKVKHLKQNEDFITTIQPVE